VSLLAETRKPPFYAVVYTTAPEGYRGYDFEEAASLLVALAANQPGYLGFETEPAADGRTVAVCYWDSYAAMADWRKRAGNWIPASLDPESFIAGAGCLWPWQSDRRRPVLRTDVRAVA